jgi:tRNA threonylcarbamoyladenosine biosynthesis protein TsaB
MSEVYWGCYEIVAGAAVLDGLEQVSAPAAVHPPDKRNWQAVGNAWQVHRLATAGMVLDSTGNLPQVPHARDVLCLAEPAFAAGLAVNARDARPSYLREQVAQPPGSNLN